MRSAARSIDLVDMAIRSSPARDRRRRARVSGASRRRRRERVVPVGVDLDEAERLVDGDGRRQRGDRVEEQAPVAERRGRVDGGRRPALGPAPCPAPPGVEVHPLQLGVAVGEAPDADDADRRAVVVAGRAAARRRAGRTSAAGRPARRRRPGSRPRRAARRGRRGSSRSTVGPVARPWSTRGHARRHASGLLDRRPGQQQALLADAGEADHDLGLVALALDLEDHALAPLGVDDVVADLQARCASAPCLAGPVPLGRSAALDDAVPVGVDARRREPTAASRSRRCRRCGRRGWPGAARWPPRGARGSRRGTGWAGCTACRRRACGSTRGSGRGAPGRG